MSPTAHAPGTVRAFDLLDPEFYLHDPHAAYTWMRANEPVYRDETNGLWAVTRHADIRDVESRAADFVSSRGYRSFHSPDETNMIAQDDPRHVEQRHLIARRFTPRAVRVHGDWIRSTVRSMVDAFADEGEVEVVNGLAAQLPCRLTARLLGWPEERWPDVKSWSERLMRYDRIHLEPQVAMDMMMAIIEFNTDLQEMAAERRGCPVHDDSDLVAVWANATVGGEPLDDATLMHETGLFISGGAETTRTVIARALRAFCDHNDQWEAVAADPSLVPSAVDEMIRWVTPLNNFFRTAARDTHIADQPVSEGDRVILLYPSANRDDAVFADPFSFDVTRNPNPHVGFGFGTHYCLGASLARFELGIVVEELTSRLTSLRVVEDTDDEPNMFATGVRSFRLGFDRRS
jgi:cytochrome P450 family 142 subfamily A polypeptide 1